jgi:competence protein ComEA
MPKHLLRLLPLLCCLLTTASVLALEVNTANEAELDSVRGLGPSSTERILVAREQGPFKSWADLMQRVKGIKPATASKLSVNGLTVNQLPFTAPEPGAKAP